jgi:hypothetical protein
VTFVHYAGLSRFLSIHFSLILERTLAVTLFHNVRILSPSISSGLYPDIKQAATSLPPLVFVLFPQLHAGSSFFFFRAIRLPA